MRVAILGATGQLGRDLCSRLAGDVIPLSRAEMDLANTQSIGGTVAHLGAHVIVNCAAYNFVDRAESEVELAFAANAWGAGALARACLAANIKLVHFSTDYVFGLDSERSTPFAETDPPGPVNTYGLSKLVGEYLVRRECPAALVIRTCGLYGASGSGGKRGNFVETMLRLAGEGRAIRVVNDQRCTPSYTVDVAEATLALLQSGASGLFHVTNGGACSWFEFAAELFRQSGVKPDLIPISSAEYGTAAPRPRFSVLSNAKRLSAASHSQRMWFDALASYLKEREKRSR